MRMRSPYLIGYFDIVSAIKEAILVLGLSLLIIMMSQYLYLKDETLYICVCVQVWRNVQYLIHLPARQIVGTPLQYVNKNLSAGVRP